MGVVRVTMNQQSVLALSLSVCLAGCASMMESPVGLISEAARTNQEVLRLGDPEHIEAWIYKRRELWEVTRALDTLVYIATRGVEEARCAGAAEAYVRVLDKLASGWMLRLEPSKCAGVCSEDRKVWVLYLDKGRTLPSGVSNFYKDTVRHYGSYMGLAASLHHNRKFLESAATQAYQTMQRYENTNGAPTLDPYYFVEPAKCK